MVVFQAPGKIDRVDIDRQQAICPSLKRMLSYRCGFGRTQPGLQPLEATMQAGFLDAECHHAAVERIGFVALGKSFE